MERLFPLFLKLKGRKCLVVGAGAIGQSKIASLLDAGAAVQVVAALSFNWRTLLGIRADQPTA